MNMWQYTGIEGVHAGGGVTCFLCFIGKTSEGSCTSAYTRALVTQTLEKRDAKY